jgi:hypothetical protein
MPKAHPAVTRPHSYQVPLSVDEILAYAARLGSFREPIEQLLRETLGGRRGQLDVDTAQELHCRIHGALMAVAHAQLVANGQSTSLVKSPRRSTLKRKRDARIIPLDRARRNRK